MDHDHHSPEPGARRRRRPRHGSRRRLIGRHPLTLGALGLLGVSGYELWVRAEDFWAWTAGVRHLSRVRGTPFLEDLRIIFEEPRMRDLGHKMLFLACALVFAAVCLFRRSRAGWGALLLACGLAGGGVALGLIDLHPANWLQALKLASLALILFGCAANILHRLCSARHRSP